jgi:GH25 family lysozyme M1 (1,4-beta-N-acetylmuramidase)
MWFVVAPASETVHIISPGTINEEDVQHLEPTEEELISKGWIPSDLIKKYAEEFSINTEFLSKIFTDRIIYKSGGKIVYAGINPNLNKHPYDWQSLIWNSNRPEYNTTTHSALLGIDVSKYQSEINWDEVAQDGIDFAIIRLGYRGYSSGALVMDEYFQANIKGAQNVGIKIGVYFFSQAINRAEAIEEAEYILAEIKDYNVTLPIVFDMEEVSGTVARTDDLSAEQVTEIMTAFCKRIKQAGHTPVIYGNSKWFVSRMNLEKLEDYEKWIAQYFKVPAFPYNFSIWQFTDSGTVKGINGKVDMDLVFIEN